MLSCLSWSRVRVPLPVRVSAVHYAHGVGGRILTLGREGNGPASERLKIVHELRLFFVEVFDHRTDTCIVDMFGCRGRKSATATHRGRRSWGHAARHLWQQGRRIRDDLRLQNLVDLASVPLAGFPFPESRRFLETGAGVVVAVSGLMRGVGGHLKG